MNNIFLKLMMIILLLTNGFLLLQKKRCVKRFTQKTDEKKLNSNKNIYKQLLELYFESKEKFYAKGRDYLLNRNGKIYNESNSITFKDKLNYLLIYESPENKTNIVDKILLRNYSVSVLGKDICTPILKIYNDIEEIYLMNYQKNLFLNVIMEAL